MMTETELLTWVRGPGFQIATIIFVLGIMLRLFEILMLGRKANLAEAKGSEMSSGLRTVFSRTIPDASTFKRSAFTVTAGYIFHIGLFVVIFLFAPHILLFKDIIGFGWPALPSTVIDATAVITIITLVIVLVHRLRDPVKRFLSNFDDYLGWFVTILPLITGYIAFHRIGMSAPSLIAIHILSVELLMVVFPFTKLMHMFTLILARWYNGAISGYRGVQS
jgi:nitrate reductase gamma subunit